MSESKHTPGPWRLRELYDGAYTVYGEGEYNIIFPLLTGISTLTGKANAKSIAAAKANACLIAAAPELWEALGEVEELVSTKEAILKERSIYDNSFGDKYLESAHRLESLRRVEERIESTIKAAIAKAEATL